MSKYDKDYQDFLEEKILNNYIDENEENEDIEIIINENFGRDKIKEYTNEENMEYLDFILDKILKEDKEKRTNKYEQKNKYLNLIKSKFFQNQKTKSDKIDYLINYLKYKYSIITGNILYSLFRDKNDKFENAMTISDYKNFILINFSQKHIKFILCFSFNKKLIIYNL